MRMVSKEQNDEHRYDDMLDLPHHVSGTHKHMSMDQRAAQFAPFAALTGYDEAIKESSRLTETRRELSDEEKDNLDHKIQMLVKNEALHPLVLVTYFTEDPDKEGGMYHKKKGHIRKVDTAGYMLLFTDHTSINMHDIDDIAFIRNL